jgi:predicted secreted protein
MYLFTNFLLFVIIWWIIFFICLPFRISVSENPHKGHATSAPNKTYIGLKVIISTAISTIIMIFLIIIKFDLGMIFKQ